MRKLMRWAAITSLAIAATGLMTAAPVVASADDAVAPAPVAETPQGEGGEESIDGRYMVLFNLNDPSGALSNYMEEVELGKQTLSQVVAVKGRYQEGDIVKLGDGELYRFERWSASSETGNLPEWNKPLQQSYFSPVKTDTGEYYRIEVTAEWELAGDYSAIYASQATDYGANAFFTGGSVDAFKSFVERTNARALGVKKAELTAAQQPTLDSYLLGNGYEALAIIDVAVDEYLNSDVEGYLNVKKHDIAPSDGINMRLRLFEINRLIGDADINDLAICRIPDDGGEVEYLANSVIDGQTIDILNVNATGTFVIARPKQVPNPWDETGALLPYTIKSGVMTFNGRPDLGEWYQLTVEKGAGIKGIDVPAGGTAWTMTIDACNLNGDDPLYTRQPNSGTYFVRGDGQGMHTNLMVSYDDSKALSFELEGDGTAVRSPGSPVLVINLNEPATLKLSTSNTTTVKNESGAFVEYAVDGGSSEGSDMFWSTLSLVTEWLGGDTAKQAGDAVNAVVSNIEKLFVYDIHLENSDGSEFAIPEGDSVKVTLPLPEGMGVEGVRVFHVAEDGTVTDMKGVVDPDARTITFTTTHFSTFVIAQVKNEGPGAGDGETGNIEKPKGELPQTGDVSMLAVAALAVAGAGSIVLGRKRR